MSEPGRLERLRRRTSIARAGLAAVLVGLLALCLVVSRSYEVRHAPLVASGSSGIIVLDLSASVFEGGFEATVRKLVRTDERAGLVVFSDSAYELLPPGSSGREFQPLLRQLHGWQVEDGKKIAKSYRFKNFIEAVAFVDAIVPVAEAEGHHPDLFVKWGEVRVCLWTHAASGLTENDFVMAAKIDQMHDRRSSA